MKDRKRGVMYPSRAPGRNPDWFWRGFAAAIAALLFVACLAFTVGHQWNSYRARGPTDKARDFIKSGPSEDSDEMADQCWFRLHADLMATVDMAEQFVDEPGWRGEQARLYMSHWKERVK